MNRKRGEDASATETYASVSDDVANRIQQATGLDVRGGRHVISGSEILHALKRHGPGSGDHRPITREDFANLYEVITNADEIGDAGKTDLGLPGIMYKKRVNGHTLVVEEYRHGRGRKKRLAFKTMYKIKT